MPTITILLRLLIAAILGGLIGWERKNVAANSAGTKTYSLVAMGSALFTLLSFAGFTGTVVDPTRIAAQVAVGIGFIGAGMIITQGGEVKGLTTAAGLWVSAAIGMAVAVGWYVVAIVSATAIFLGLLLAHEWFYKNQP